MHEGGDGVSRIPTSHTQETVLGVEPVDPTEYLVGQNVEIEALPKVRVWRKGLRRASEGITRGSVRVCV